MRIYPHEPSWLVYSLNHGCCITVRCVVATLHFRERRFLIEDILLIVQQLLDRGPACTRRISGCVLPVRKHTPVKRWSNIVRATF